MNILDTITGFFGGGSDAGKIDFGRLALASKFGADILSVNNQGKANLLNSRIQKYNNMARNTEQITGAYQDMANMVDDTLERVNYNTWLAGERAESMSDDASITANTNLYRGLGKNYTQMIDRVRAIQKSENITNSVIDANLKSQKTDNMFGMANAILNFAGGWFNRDFEMTTPLKEIPEENWLG